MGVAYLLLSVWQSIYLSIYLFLCVNIYLSIHVYIMSVCVFITSALTPPQILTLSQNNLYNAQNIYILLLKRAFVLNLLDIGGMGVDQPSLYNTEII